MILCKRCKKVEAVDGKKNCLACAKYMSEYMKQMRAKKKVLDAVEVPKLEIHKNLANVPLVINENPDYVFVPVPDVVHKYDPEKKTLVNVNNESVNKNNVNNVNFLKKKYDVLLRNLDDNLNPGVSLNFEKIKLSPEDFRYFYFRITGKVFRENKIECIKELIKILECEL